MKRVVLVVVVVLLLMVGMAGAEDFAAMSTEELKQKDAQIEAELISRQMEESGRVLVSDTYGVKILFDGFAKSAIGTDKIRFIILNNSEETLPLHVSIEKLYIENWDVLYNGFLHTLDQGKSAVGEGQMEWDKCLTADQETATRIDVQFEFAVEREKYKREVVHTTDLITFYIKK